MRKLTLSVALFPLVFASLAVAGDTTSEPVPTKVFQQTDSLSLVSLLQQQIAIQREILFETKLLRVNTELLLAPKSARCPAARDEQNLTAGAKRDE
ncbi:hypothetical protein [Serratia odorifera]|uniref:Uncharacterized protein n=2 Tax=Serratia odorifera TaxID=618 RepID=D4EA50_SEROD|nr:hypothetical protein [Serratia odorifera]EFE93318.1 hypothetical protein HMPREF0758_5050 [Serratia odorifera DSM 4582]PNK88307.1 hypothetical protein CEQ31_000535 [Serratia odorifera]RII73959.1 hypothetical protein DX901_00950 [Serratia odorifera]VDZ51170.1 Uncharacterised protein [Serratia odorifera]